MATATPRWERALEKQYEELATRPAILLPQPRPPRPPTWPGTLRSAWDSLIAEQDRPPAAPLPIRPPKPTDWDKRLERPWKALTAPTELPERPPVRMPDPARWEEVLKGWWSWLHWGLLDLPQAPTSLRIVRRRAAQERAERGPARWERQLEYLYADLTDPVNVELPAPRQAKPAAWDAHLRAAWQQLTKPLPVVRPAETAPPEEARFVGLTQWEQMLWRDWWALQAPIRIPRSTPRRPATPAWEVELDRDFRSLSGAPGVTLPPAASAAQTPDNNQPTQPLAPEQLDERLRALRRDEGLYDATRRAAHVEPTHPWKARLRRRGLKPQPFREEGKGRKDRGWRWNERGARLRLVPALAGSGWLHTGRWLVTVHKTDTIRRTTNWWGGTSRSLVTETVTTAWWETTIIRPHRRAAHEAGLEWVERKHRLGGVDGALKKPRWLTEDEWRYRLEQSAEFAALLGPRPGADGW